MKEKRKYNYQISTHHIDFQKNVTLSSLFHIIMKTAGRDADDNGFGLLKLQANDLSWVLSRFVLDLERFPKEDEDITIETWVEDVQTLFTTRNFRITNGGGKIIGYASSSWAIIDVNTRRSVGLDTMIGLSDFVIPETTPIGVLGRLPDVDGEVANDFQVKYSHIDVNGHASSPYYIQWIADCFPLDFYKDHRLKRFEINFMREITFGDKGEVSREMKEKNDYYFQISTAEVGLACRARMLFLDEKCINDTITD